MRSNVPLQRTCWRCADIDDGRVAGSRDDQGLLDRSPLPNGFPDREGWDEAKMREPEVHRGLRARSPHATERRSVRQSQIEA